MILVGVKENGQWMEYRYKTTWKNGWDEVLYYADAIAKTTENSEFFVGEVGAKSKKIQINSEKELLEIEENGRFFIKGLSKIWDLTPMRFKIFNQSRIVQIYVKTSYINSLTKEDGIHYEKYELDHIFDRFVDSIELTAYKLLTENRAVKQQVDGYIQALKQCDDFVKKKKR